MGEVYGYLIANVIIKKTSIMTPYSVKSLVEESVLFQGSVNGA